jgi:Fe-S-cluster containining protein
MVPAAIFGIAKFAQKRIKKNGHEGINCPNCGFENPDQTLWMDKAYWQLLDQNALSNPCKNCGKKLKATIPLSLIVLVGMLVVLVLAVWIFVLTVYIL